MRHKLRIDDISLEEAAKRRIEQLSMLNFSTQDKEIVIPEKPADPEAKMPRQPEIRYKLSQATEHLRAFLRGEISPIGLFEAEVMRVTIAYEQGRRRKT